MLSLLSCQATSWHVPNTPLRDSGRRQMIAYKVGRAPMLAAATANSNEQKADRIVAMDGPLAATENDIA